MILLSSAESAVLVSLMRRGCGSGSSRSHSVNTRLPSGRKKERLKLPSNLKKIKTWVCFRIETGLGLKEGVWVFVRLWSCGCVVCRDVAP